MVDIWTVACTLADPDYYQPPRRYRDPSPQLRPGQMPGSWRQSRLESWTIWSPPDVTAPAQGWKIHVSAMLERAGAVLEQVAAVCVAERVPFKHLATEFAFVYAHHKHGSRAQAGKFCSVYPSDEQQARRLLESLAQRLRDEDGPHILTDRRYRDSRTVHYRYGAFRPLSRIRPDGTVQHQIRDTAGRLVDDVRGVRFVLPDGITDPFTDSTTVTPVQPRSAGGVRLGDYQVVGALSHSNAGGTYRAVAPSGEQVFIKEARAHNGLHWDRSTAQARLRREYQVLCDLHARAPGLAPRPIDYFRRWEHEFMVTELVPGRPVFRHISRQNAYLQPTSVAEFDRYFQFCRDLLAQLSEALDRLHQLGYRFGEVSPNNLLIAEDGTLRLVDFEASNRLDEPPVTIGEAGYVPTQDADWAGTGADTYGLGALALTMVMPFHQQAERHPAGLAHLYADLSRRRPVPPDLWQVATRNYRVPEVGPAGADGLPAPEAVAADPLPHLRTLREALAREIAATARPDDPDAIWPTIPAGYATNTWCVAYGAAGVLHALHRAGLPIDPAVVGRLRREAVTRRGSLPPGLHFGTAGIAWVLAEQGQLDEAVALIRAATNHPVTSESASWGAGSAGVGTACLAMYGYTGDEEHLDRAVRIGETLCATDDPAASLGPRRAVGLLHGRAGLALFLHHLWRATGEKRYLRHGVGLLHAELANAIEMPGGELGFREDAIRRRAMVYLAVGAAGVGHVLTRYVGVAADERLADAMPRVFRYADQQSTVAPGLYLGLAGLAFAQADHNAYGGAGDPAGSERAVRVAAGLVKYAVPGPAGRMRFLGASGLRFSVELWSGAAGILLALDRVLSGSNGHLFTLDDLPGRAVDGPAATSADRGDRRRQDP